MTLSLTYETFDRSSAVATTTNASPHHH